MDCSLSCKTSFDDLPDGLVVDILSRLPVKMILQSTCVSKLWYSIIKTPSFVSSHLSRSVSNPSSYYIYLFRNYTSSITVISDNHLLTFNRDFVFPSEIISTSIGTCKGLVCATDYYFLDIFLINHFIHKYKKLKIESSRYADWVKKYHRGLLGVKVGFGYSEVENDYKIVRIFNRYPCSPQVIHTVRDVVYGPHDLESKVEIFSLKSGEWKSVDVSFELSSYYSLNSVFEHGCFVHGCLYWIQYNLYGQDKYLLCFDLKDEVFSRIEFPPTYLQLDNKESLSWRTVLIKNDSVAVVGYNHDFDRIIPCMRIYIFVLEKNVGGQVQWKELYYECDYFNARKCIGFSSVGRLLFVERDSEDYMVAVDLDNSCAIETISLDYSGIVNGSTTVMESLVLLLD